MSNTTSYLQCLLCKGSPNVLVHMVPSQRNGCGSKLFSRESGLSTSF